MSEPRPSSPQSRTASGPPFEPMGTRRFGSDGATRTSAQTTQTFLADGFRKDQPDRSLPLNREIQPADDGWADAGAKSAARNSAGKAARIEEELRIAGPLRVGRRAIPEGPAPSFYRPDAPEARDGVGVD